jgi:hypothetical protein
MIVLVEERQRQALKAAEKDKDRYEREAEVTSADELAVTGTPEPEEWLLLFLVAAGLLWLHRQQRAGVPRAA